MKERIVFRPEALAELEAAVEWYELSGNGLGAEYLRAFEAALARIHRRPALYPKVHGHLRRAPIRKFPYNIYYLADDRELLIVACFHSSRNPERWKERLAKS